MTAPTAKQYRIGPIRLSPGITPREIVFFFITITVASSMVSFCALFQPLLYNDVLHLPLKIQGRVSGLLASLQQLMFLTFIGVAGALADRWGRKVMLVLALSGFSICAFLFPLVSSLAMLVAVRVLFGLAQNGHTAGAPVKMFDYPDNASRGKFMAMAMVILGISNIVLVGALGSHLPSWIKQAGFSEGDAGRYSFWIAAAVGAAAVTACVFGLRNDRPARPAASESRGFKAFLSGFRQVYDHALISPGFGLLMITGFVIRTDSTVLQSFVSLWVVNAGHGAGMSTAQALKVAGGLTALQSSAFLVIPALFGILLDRFNRIVLYIGAMAFSGVALIATTLVHDVSSWPIYVAIGVIGLAESAQTITQQALFGQEAPAHLRGTAYGVFASTGTLSVVIIAAVSGVLFDRIGYTAPFVLAGALHIVFLIIALIFMAVRMGRRVHNSTPVTDAKTAPLEA